MKTHLSQKLVLAFILFVGASVSGQDQAREFYAFKIYSFDSPAQEKEVDAYLRDAYIPALKRQGIKETGVFKIHSNGDSVALKTFVLVPFRDLSQFEGLEISLMADKAYLAGAVDYLEAPHDTPPYSRVETVLMRAFKDMPWHEVPKLEGDRSDRVYELRSYESPNELFYNSKVDMFNAGGEIELFDQLGFNAVFYADVLAGSRMPNLMYMTAFSDMESRDAHWKAFFDSPKWKELSNMEKYQNNVSHADILLLYPTPYSDY